jgi:hypothetical protein
LTRTGFASRLGGVVDNDLLHLRTSAQLDQAFEGLKTTALLAGRYFQELRGQGFEKAQALALVIAWQAEVIRVGQNQQKGRGGG